MATVDYGTYGGSTPILPVVVPSRSDNVLVSSVAYDSSGEAYQTIDPAGREDRLVRDALGRVTKTIQNYKDGIVSAAAPDEDVTMETTYNADGKILTLTAKNPTTGDQVTKHVCGTTLSDSQIASADLLGAKICPVPCLEVVPRSGFIEGRISTELAIRRFALRGPGSRWEP